MQTIKNDLQQYFKQQQYRWQGHRWLQANGVALAARLMFQLNQYAGSTQRHEAKDYVYRLKNCFIHWLYQNGYCQEVRQQIQTLRCNSCIKGIYYGCGTEEECWHCGGTGIYRETILYQFRFGIGGQVYIWHQPSSLVWWPVTLKNEMPNAWQATKSDSKYRFLSIEQVELYSLTLYEFLRKQRALESQSWVWVDNWTKERRMIKRIEPPVTVEQMTKHWQLHLEHQLQRRWRQIKRHFVRPVQHRLTDDEIPF
jgi:hypothetical protein